MLFLTKDRTLAIPLLEGLLKYWPFANCIKETLFLTELQEVLEVCEVDKVEHLIPKLFKRIVKCIIQSAFNLLFNKHSIKLSKIIGWL